MRIYLPVIADRRECGHGAILPPGDLALGIHRDAGMCHAVTLDVLPGPRRSDEAADIFETPTGDLSRVVQCASPPVGGRDVHELARRRIALAVGVVAPARDRV